MRRSHPFLIGMEFEMDLQLSGESSLTERAKKKKKPEYIPVDPGLTVEHVAVELGIDRSSARRLIISQIRQYVVAAGKRKKSYRVRRSVLLRWREAQERQSLKASKRAGSLSIVAGGRVKCGTLAKPCFAGFFSCPAPSRTIVTETPCLIDRKS